MNCRLRRSRKAFSLTELLVVIVIIGILAALVIAVVSSAMKRTDAAGCASNLRQIGMAMDAYASDHGQEYPKAINSTSTSGTAPDASTTWMWKLIPYTGMAEDSMGPAPLPRSAGIFVCPSFDGNNAQRKVSYAYNIYVEPSTQIPWDYKALRVPNPGKTILLVEIDANAENFSPNRSPDVTRRHPGNAANFLFADGHVESIKEVVPASDSRWHW